MGENMRKMRNVILGILVFLSTIMFSACSCGEQPDTTVYPTSITLSCTDTNNYTHRVEDGVLYINVYKNAVFVVDYVIEPNNVSNSQVDIAISDQAVRINGTSLSTTGVENSVEFRAREMGEATITFSVHNVKDAPVTATCIVTVADKASNIESLTIPRGLSYSVENHTITWDKVEATVDDEGTENNIVEDGVAVGLEGYEVKVIDEEGNETTEVVKTNSYSNFELGKTYTVSVKALGDKFHAKDSEDYSIEYSFYQLEVIDDLSVEDGVVTWSPITLSTNYKVFYGTLNKGEENESICTAEVVDPTYTLGSETYLDEYSVYVVAYPQDGLIDESKDYVEVAGVRYFKSPKSTTTLSVVQIKNLEWKLNNATTGNVTVEDYTFGSATSNSVLTWKFADNMVYASAYEVGYIVNVYECDAFGEIAPGATPVLTTEKVTTDKISFGDYDSQGYYKVQVQAVGNSSNTLKPALMETDPIYITPKIADSEISIVDNKIKYQTSNAASYAAIEYYFIEASSSDNNYKYQTDLDELTLSNIGLNSGTYDVYAKIVGDSAVSTNSSVSEKLTTFTILGKVNNSYMLKNGNICFTPVANADSYSLKIVRNSDTESPVPTTIPTTVHTTGETAYINIFDDIKAYLESNTLEDIDNFLTAGTHTYSLIARSDNSEIIDGGESNAKVFNRQNPILSASLNSGVVTWLYNDNMFTDYTEVEITLNDTTLDGAFRNLTQLDTSANSQANSLITLTENNGFEFVVRGKDGNLSEPCVLDSKSVYVSFAVTNIVSSLNVVDTLLDWSVPATSTGDHYTISIYKYIEDGDDQLLDTIDDITDTSIALETVSNKIKEINDAASTDNNLVSTRICVSVTQKNNNKFTNAESEKYFFYFYDSPTLSLDYEADDTSYNLTWNRISSVSGIDTVYDLKIMYRAVSDSIPTVFRANNAITSDVTCFNIGALGSAMSAGLYDATITVKVVDSYYGNEYVNAATTPYYLFASSDNTSFTVVDGSTCNLKYVGKSLVWTDMSAVLPDLGGYTLKYKVAGSVGEYTTLAQDIQDYQFGNFAPLSHNPYDFELTINPSYSYLEDNKGIDYILTNNIVNISNITKLQTIQEAGTENGGFYFNSVDKSSNTNFEIYKNNVILRSGVDYDITDSITHSTYYTYYVRFNFAINESINITFRTYAENYIDSDMSAEFNVRPIRSSNISNVVRENADGDNVHYFKWKKTSDEISHFELTRVSPSKVYTLYVSDASNNLDDTTKNFFLIDDYYYYLFDDNETVLKTVGTYRYSVRAFTTTTGYLNSNASEEMLVIKLNDVIDITLNNGVVAIGRPSGTSMSNTYDLTISLYTLDTDTQEKVYDEAHTEVITLDTSSSHEIDFTKYDKLRETGSYAISAVFVGGYETVDPALQKTAYYISSNPSEEKNYIKSDTPSVYMLNGEVAWTNPIGNIGNAMVVYGVKIENTTKTKVYNLNTTSTTLTNAMIKDNNIDFAEDEVYNVTVSANAVGYLNSEVSDSYTVIKLINPTDFRIDVEMGTTEEDDEGNPIEVSTKVFKWNNNNPKFRLDEGGNYVKVGNNYVLYDPEDTNHTTLDRYSYTSTSYKIYYINQAGNVEAVQEVSDNINVISQSINTALAVGEYTCYMQIIGSTDLNTMSVGYISSDISDTIALSIREESQSVTIENNDLKWESVDGAYAYRIEFDYLGTDPTVSQGFSLYSRECVMNLGSTEMSNYDVFGSYKVSVYSYTEYAANRAYLITTNTNEQYGYNQKNSLSLFKADSVTDFKVLDGMFSWTITLDSLSKYLEYNSLNINQVKEGGFDTGLDLGEEVEYSDKEKNQVRAIRYIQGRINNTVDMDPNLDKALSPYLNFKFDINGIEIEVKPTKLEGLDSAGNVINFVPNTYLTGNRIRYYFDLVRDNKDTELVNITTGFYNVAVASYGNTTLPTTEATAIVSSNYTASMKVYKPETPISATADSLYSDIVNSDVYWNLVTTDNTLATSAEFFAEYRMVATPFVTEGTEPNPELKVAYNDISFNGGDNIITNTGNETNFNIKSANVSSLFTTDEENASDNNYILPNEAYNLSIYVRGTKNSDQVTFEQGVEPYYYINGSSMQVNTYMCMLDTPTDFHIANGVITWTNSLYASKIRLRIYGTYDLEYDYGTDEEADYNTRNWQLYAYDNVAGSTSLHTGIEVSEVVLNTSGADGINRYVLGPQYTKGGYAVAAQAVGNSLGVVDSNLTNADNSVYAVKLDSTEVALNKGNFVWPLVQDATSYYVEVYGNKKDGSASDTYQGSFHYATNIVTKKIDGVDHAVYDLDGSYNDETLNYYVRVSPRNQSITQNVGYLYGDFAKSGAYARLNAPELTEINTEGTLLWDISKISINHIERFVLYSNYSDREDNTVTIETECGTQNQAKLTPDEEYATQAFTVQVRVMSKVDNMLNSAKSTGFKVLMMERPDLRVDNGDIAWDNSPKNKLGSEVVDSNLAITYKKGQDTVTVFEDTVKATDPHVYMLYQTITDNNYVSTEADSKYPTTTYTVKVNFVGTIFNREDIDEAEEEEADFDKYYYLASQPTTLSVRKLPKLTIASSTVQEGDAVVSYARWQKDESCENYAVFVYATYGAGGKNFVASRYDTMTKGTYFKDDTVNGVDYKYFNIDAILNDGGDISAVATEDNLKLYIYVQAVGTLQSTGTDTTFYVNGNYSDSLEISVPPTPIITGYENGKIEWETVVESGYDIEGVVSYKADVSEDMLNSYWKLTSNKIQEGTNGFITNDLVDETSRQDEVTHRELTYTLIGEVSGVNYYSIVVVDSIKLDPIKGNTQTHYYLNQVGTDYSIRLRASVHSEDDAVVEGNYKSAWTEDYTVKNMLLFADGDGTRLNPYLISNDAQLLRLGNYPTRHFKVVSSGISVDWTTIFTTKETEFTGSIDGNGNRININKLTTTGSGVTDIGFIGYNAGTIKNLEINYLDIAITSNLTNVGGMVVYNGGTLQQVSVTGYIAVSRSDNTRGGLYVGGIATYNGYQITANNTTTTYPGVITYASTSATLISQVKSQDTSYAGGITANNYGTISHSGSLEGAYIKANWVGGVAVYNYNIGKITNTFSKGLLEVYDKNVADTYSTAYLGGVVANNLGDIDNSYSIAKFKMTREGGYNYLIGGLIGVNNTATGIQLTNNYAVFRNHAESNITSSNAGNNIGGLIGRCMNSTSNVSAAWMMYYHIESGITGLNMNAIGTSNATMTVLIPRSAAEMKRIDFASQLGAVNFSYYNYINEGYCVLNSEFDLMFASNSYYYVVNVNISKAYYSIDGDTRIEVPNSSLSGSYEFKEQNPDDVQYSYTIVLDYSVTYAGEVVHSGEVGGSSPYCYYSVEAPEGDNRNFAVSASTLGEYVVRVYLTGDFVTFGDILTSVWCTTGTDALGDYVEFTWTLAMGD